MSIISSYFEKISIKQLIIVNILSAIICSAVFFIVVSPKLNLGINAKSLASVTTTPKDAITDKANVSDAEVEPTPTPTPEPTPKPIPVKLEIPSVNLVAPVIPVGFVKETGEIKVPADAGDVGWYKYGTVPGDLGSSIMSGHFDTPTGAPAIFSDLEEVQVGDTFKVTNQQAKELTYKVKAVRNLPLQGFPKDLIFGDRDFSQLTLMTCSGVFNRATQLYSHRLSVIGVLESTKKIDYIPEVDEGVDQYLVDSFTYEQNDQKLDITGPYIRLESDQEKISIFLATNNTDIVAMDAIIQFDPTYLNFDKDLISFNNAFESYYAHMIDVNKMSIALFTDPQKGSLPAFNSEAKEIKVAEAYFTRNTYNPDGTFVSIINEPYSQITSKLLKYTQGQEIHQSPNVLNFTEGTAVKL